MHWHIVLFEPRANCMTQDDDGEWASTPTRILRARGYEIFYPAFPRKTERHYGITRMTMRPMFPGYGFVCESPRGWEALRTTPGVRTINSLLMINGRFAVLPEGEIDRIAAKQNQLIHEALNPAPVELDYGVGDTVRVTAGAFQDRYAKIEALDDQERIALLMDIFGRPTRVYASHDQLAATH
jgi:transcriptional antiterminator RfaH